MRGRVAQRGIHSAEKAALIAAAPAEFTALADHLVTHGITLEMPYGDGCGAADPIVTAFHIIGSGTNTTGPGVSGRKLSP